MSSRPSSLLVSRDLESYPTLYVAIYSHCVAYSIRITCHFHYHKDHYVFCYEVLADYVEKMDAYHNFKTLM